MFGSGSFAEARMNEVEISHCSRKSLEYIVHTISGCKNCAATMIDEASYSYETACEIMELANRFLLSKKLVNYIESNIVHIFQSQTAEANLDFFWSNFFHTSEFQHLVFENGMSYWKKFILMELIKKSVDNEKWQRHDFSEQEVEMIRREYVECLNF